MPEVYEIAIQVSGSLVDADGNPIPPAPEEPQESEETP